jgi:hypothetical protein
MNTPWWVWKNVVICQAISPAFFPVPTACSVSVQGNNLGMQKTKPIFVFT